MAASTSNPFAKNHGLVSSNIGIMLVDEEPSSLLLISTLLISCHYRVEIFTSVIEALATLSDRIREFDLVIANIHLIIMPGVQLVQRIKRDFDIPIITMDAGDSKLSSIAIDSGAWNHLVKPITISSFEIVWQKAWKKERKELTNITTSPKDEGISGRRSIKQVGRSSSKKSLTKYKRKKTYCDGEETNSKDQKRRPLKWEGELHQRFLVAVRLLGQLAIPKKIIDMMNVEGLTIKQVASHLQKYRERIEKGEPYKTDKNALLGLPPSLRTQFPISFGPKQAPANIFQANIAMLMNAHSGEGNAKFGQPPMASNNDSVHKIGVKDDSQFCNLNTPMEKNTVQDPITNANDEWPGLEEFLGIGESQNSTGKEKTDGIGSSTDFPSDDDFDFDFDFDFD